MKNMSLRNAAMHQPAVRRRAFQAPSKALVAALVVLSVFALSATANAEGNWTSNLAAVRTGFNSRQFQDSQLDNAGTVISMSGCSRNDGANANYKAELKRIRVGPDATYGKINFDQCPALNLQHNYGKPAATGKFYITYSHWDFGTINATRVGASY